MSRYRTENTPSPMSNVTVSTTGTADVVYPVSLYNAFSRSMTDEVIPFFRKRSAAGEIFNNPYSSSRVLRHFADTRVASYEETPEYGTFKTSNKYANGSAMQLSIQDAVITFPEVSLATSEAANRAAIECLANVNSTDADLGNMMIEWDKTRRLHRDLGTALSKAILEGAKAPVSYDKVSKTPLYDRFGNPVLNRKGKPIYRYLHQKVERPGRGRLAKAKRISDVYLSVRMGLLPLLSDLEGACRALFSSTPRRNTARGMASVYDTVESVRTVSGGFGQNHTVNVATTKIWTVRYGILYETSTIGRLAAKLGLTRPLSTAWESFPWSFVADWFVNVGAWLDAIQPNGASKTLSAWVSTTETIVKTAFVNSDLVDNTAEHLWSDRWHGGYSEIAVFKDRRPWILTAPTLPGLGSGFDKQIRCLDTAALLLQRLNTKLR